MLKLDPRNRNAEDAPGQDPQVTRKRFLRRQRARRWLVWRRVLLVVLPVVAAVTLVWLVFFSSVLSVKGAVVEGTSVLSKAEVAQVADVPVGVPLATADLAAVQARVEALAPVASAEVSRSWPDRIRIDVTERTAVAVTQREGVWRGLDEEGVLFRSYPKRPAGLPEVRMKASTPVDALAESAQVVAALPSAILTRVSYLDVQTIDDISFTFRNGSRVTWGSADESAAKAEVLQVLLKRDARVYDVTAPGRPTIRP